MSTPTILQYFQKCYKFKHCIVNPSIYIDLSFKFLSSYHSIWTLFKKIKQRFTKYLQGYKFKKGLILFVLWRGKEGICTEYGRQPWQRRAKPITKACASDSVRHLPNSMNACKAQSDFQESVPIANINKSGFSLIVELMSSFGLHSGTHNIWTTYILKRNIWWFFSPSLYSLWLSGLHLNCLPITASFRFLFASFFS